MCSVLERFAVQDDQVYTSQILHQWNILRTFQVIQLHEFFTTIFVIYITYRTKQEQKKQLIYIMEQE